MLFTSLSPRQAATNAPPYQKVLPDQKNQASNKAAPSKQSDVADKTHRALCPVAATDPGDNVNVLGKASVSFGGEVISRV